MESEKKFDILVTRHPGFADWAAKKGLSWDRHVRHATVEDVEGKNVLGVTPLWLAAKARTVTEVSVPDLPARLRGTELSAKQLDQLGAQLKKYKVEEK